MLRNKAVVWITHQLELLPQCDKVRGGEGTGGVALGRAGVEGVVSAISNSQEFGQNIVCSHAWSVATGSATSRHYFCHSSLPIFLATDCNYGGWLNVILWALQC